MPRHDYTVAYVITVENRWTAFRDRLQPANRAPARVSGFVAALTLLGLLAGCTGTSAPTDEESNLRLGYLPNMTHSTALVGLERGTFARALGPDVKVDPQLFKAGGQAVEAFFSGALDAAYVGPGPAINAFEKSNGEAVRIVSGATAGGVSFVVQPWVSGAEDLRGRRLAAPQYGNTQDVALRTWLAGNGIRTTSSGEGDVEIVYQDNAQTLDTFRSGGLAGAWIPEPWASRLVLEAGGKVLVDEKDLWPDGRYAATLLLVHPRLLAEKPEVVEGLVRGHAEANEFIHEHSSEALQLTGEAIERLTGAALPAEVLESAWQHLEFTDDPIVASLEVSAREAAALGYMEPIDVADAMDLGYLNARRLANGAHAIKVAP